MSKQHYKNITKYTRISQKHLKANYYDGHKLQKEKPYITQLKLRSSWLQQKPEGSYTRIQQNKTNFKTQKMSIKWAKRYKYFFS